MELGGELDLSGAQRLSEELAPLEPLGARVVLDLAGLDFMDSAGLAALVGASRRIGSADGRVALVVPPGKNFEKVFALVGDVPFFTRHETRVQAVDALD